MPAGGGRRVESGGVAGGRRVVSVAAGGIAPGVVDGGVVTMPPGGHHQCVAHHRCCTCGSAVGAFVGLFPGTTAIGCGGRRGGKSADESAGTRTRTLCDGHHQCGAHHPYCLCSLANCARSGVNGDTAGSLKRSGVPTLSAASTNESAGVINRPDMIA